MYFAQPSFCIFEWCGIITFTYYRISASSFRSLSVRKTFKFSLDNQKWIIPGTGIKQLRENIAESKLSYEIMDDAAQAFLKTKIMDNIHKYFYMICFSAYLREQAEMASKSASDEEKASFSLTGGKG